MKPLLAALAAGVGLAGCAPKKVIEVWESGANRVEIERVRESMVSSVSDNFGSGYELKRLRAANDPERKDSPGDAR